MNKNNPINCITDLVFVENNPQKADVILIPGSIEIELIQKSVELFKQGYSDKIIISGGANSQLEKGKTEANYLANIALEMDVGKQYVIQESRARNTFENAKFTMEMIETMMLKISKAIIVAKGYHSRRALMTYQRYFPSNVQFFVVTVGGKENIFKNNWTDEMDKIEIVTGEVVKIGTYFKSEIDIFNSKYEI